ADTPWQREVEEAFPYQETPDQLKAIADAKSDMEATVPMDRLICGDVGFGKTEVAIRAAFKAVQDGKQVAVLVPTTLLAQQHTQTFSERFSGYPVRVEALSRFLTPKQADTVVKGLNDGTVDVVIGTHRAAAEAIRRELLREGQVFFVHNRVQDIEHVAAGIRELVPEARVAVAHGQMDEGSLEKIVLDFWEGEYDVLVCTTIIESGIDMPTVNTLVVDRSDLMGLGQLHQLRGRVGRAGQRAYAYLFFPPERALTEEAYERLKTIGEHTELGSGFKIAMRDLEIRGAGNLLGTGQSGHIAAV